MENKDAWSDSSQDEVLCANLLCGGENSVLVGGEVTVFYADHGFMPCG